MHELTYSYGDPVLSHASSDPYTQELLGVGSHDNGNQIANVHNLVDDGNNSQGQKVDVALFSKLGTKFGGYFGKSKRTK